MCIFYVFLPQKKADTFFVSFFSEAEPAGSRKGKQQAAKMPTRQFPICVDLTQGIAAGWAVISASASNT